jgi:DNA-directed RNA polymerase subunit beta
VKDASLYCPPGIEGTVVDCKVFSRKGAELDERSKLILENQEERLRRNLEDEKRILNDERSKRLSNMLDGKQLLADLHDEKTNKKLLAKGTDLTRDMIEKLRARDLKRMKLANKDPRLNEQVDEIEEMTSRQIAVLEKITDEKIAKLRKGDELPPGVIKQVKCYIAMKRKLSVGDKMAGRHGNKGVIARIVPEEDMPYLPDGTPVGQILETHLGWAAHALGVKFATPVFDGATEKDIKAQLKSANLPSSGKVQLADGISGQTFEQPVTVGYIYMLKLSHLVDDKIHARSIGPYSLITQQPLGGKAQFGGQRFGEMEVWALEAYGAAYVLQELLTAKSDDVYGRAKIYEAIVKGEAAAEPGVPESFNVLIRELQSLCLDVELMKKQTEEIDTALAAD